MKKKCPWIPQIEAVECGAAALGSLLAYHGKWLTLAELRQRCGVSRDGSKAGRILQAAKDLGCQARGFRCSLRCLSEVPLPAIIHWEKSHFVVLEEMRPGNRAFVVVDPAKGRRKLSAKEFAAGFSEVVLTVQPAGHFVPDGQVPTTPGLLLGQWSSGYGLLVRAILATLGMLTAGVICVFVLARWVDEVLAMDDSPRLLQLNLALVGATLLFFVGGIWRRFVLTRLGTEKIKEDTAEFLHHLLRLPLPLLQQRSPHEWAALLPAQAVRGRFLREAAGTAFLEIPAIFLMAGLMFFFDATLGLMAIGAGLVFVSVSWVSGRLLQPATECRQEAETRLEERSRLGLHLQDHLLCEGREETFLRGRSVIQEEALGAASRHEKQQAVVAWVFHVLVGSGLVLLVLAGAWQVHSASHTPGLVAGFFLALLLFFLPVLALTRALPVWRGFRESWLLREDFLAMPGEPPGNDSVPAPEGDSKLVLRRVSFAYSPFDRPVLEDISLSLSAGNILAVVGASGSGKSTLAKIAAGVLSPTSGMRAADAVRVGWVDQDVHLFTGTLWENISLWDPRVTQEDAVRALQLAQLPLTTFAGGWDTWLPEAGRRLSGGERQSIAMARVLVRKPDFLVLDESTSALSTATQAALLTALPAAGMGLLVCTHRLEAARMSDEILVLENSRVAQRGGFSLLSTQPGAFAGLFSLPPAR